MTHKFTTEKWQNFLPNSYNWLKNELEVSFVSQPQAAELTIVPIKDSTEKDKCTIQLKFADADALNQQLQKLQWKGNSGQITISINQMNYMLMPVPKLQTSNVQLARQWGMEIVKNIKDFNIKKLAVLSPQDFRSQDIYEGIASGYYETSKLKSKSSNDHLPKQICFIGNDCTEQQFKQHKTMAIAMTLTRFLQDSPPNWMDTELVAQIAKEISQECNIKCKVYGEKELAEENMHLYLSVSRGSVVPAQMIVMEVKGRDTTRCRALVGKGLTFDSGGLSLKPSTGMTDMKYDMSGGAAVLGAMYYLSHITPPTNVVGVIACAENMPSGNATKPSDLIRARNGKTVEILNTDAEGRLVLADALHFTSTTYSPEFMIDAATLTGACIQALGHSGGALLSNDQNLAEKLLNISKSVGEPFWQLPLWPEMEKEIKGDFGDYANIAKPGVMGGTIIGGIFLKEFVEKTPWVHLDIAGVAWDCKATGNPSQGGCAYSVRTMANACFLE